MSMSLTMTKSQLLVAAMLLALAASAHSQAGYPNQSIKIIVPSAAGGGADIAARILSAAMSTNAGWTVLVENKAGANGLIGAEFVAKSKPDGYTLMMGQTATMATAELMSQDRYHPLNDFVSIATITTQPLVLVVPVNSPFKSLADVVAALKAKGLNMGSAGTTTVGHLVGEDFAKNISGKVTTVPYKGTAPALQDLAGGQTDFMFSLPPSVMPLVQGGRLRPLAVTATKRLPILPDVPTTAEAGYKDVLASEWKVLAAPTGTPPFIIQRLHAEVQKMLAQPTHVAKIVGDGSLPMPSSQAEAQAFVKAEFDRWTSFMRATGAGK